MMYCSRTRDCVLFHFVCAPYDPAMIILRTNALAAATLLVAIAVVVNFARPAPVGFADDNVETAYATEEVEAPASNNGGPKCPCPTEIEKADCDEGLCSATLGAAKRVIASATPLSHEVLILDAWDSAIFAPDPDPPRAAG